MTRKALVVEDSNSARAFLRAVMESEEFVARLGVWDVAEAACGFDAMRLLPRGPYDVIVTDINMPDINGLELIHFIRKSEHHRATPLVIVSTQSTERDVNRGLALGANAFLPKPFRPEELVTVFERVLSPAGPSSNGEGAA